MGRNGTFLVVRKLSQDVAGFKNEMVRQARYVFGDKAEAERMAALMLGRWPSGCPVDVSHEKDDPEIAQDLSRLNAFTYEREEDGKNKRDKDGDRCPIGAHIRRVNPRDLDVVKGKLVVEPMSTRHRMIRRSLPYGPPFKETVKDGVIIHDGEDRGLMFTALVADIGRQFEFVQRNWINDGDSSRLDRTDRDPLVGSSQGPRDLQTQGWPHAERKFTVPAGTRLPWALKLPEFVKTKGGEYFCMPSVTALQELAKSQICTFLGEYEAYEQGIADPMKRAIAQKDLISDWLNDRPHEMLQELLDLASGADGTKPRTFQMPGYQVFGDPRYSIPSIAITTKHADVLDVLKDSKMSVSLYKKNMEVESPRPPRGPFILGRDTEDPFYKLEAPLLAKAIQACSLTGGFRDLVEKEIVDPIFASIERKNGELDVVQDLAWPIPLIFVRSSTEPGRPSFMRES